MATNFGNWMYDRILGSGGFGQVELWINKYTNEKIAIKRCMLPNNERNPKQMQRWVKEIENMKQFAHPNIVQSKQIPIEIIFDSPVLCMEFCNKGDLRKILNKPENACGLIQTEALNIMKDISSALKYLHFNNITHRDLKPENIVLHANNQMVVYKLIDLGYAKKLSNNAATASLVGTFNYVAPELFRNNRYTCAIDYWSLGILFFEVLTGYKPFMPYSKNLMKWFSYMEIKKYEEICATNINGTIKFHNCIIYPNDLSEDILNNILEWFQVVLQMSPNQRGKRLDSDEIVVFSLLKEIFPWKTIYIFSVSQYQIDQYSINENNTLLDLQEWIEKKTSICINEQIIIDTRGNRINKNKDSVILLKNLNDPILYIYNNASLEVTDSNTNWNIPKILDILLDDPQEINDRSMLRQCYTALIYNMRYEVTLFKQYIFALGIKLDLIYQTVALLKVDIDQNLPNINSFLNEINQFTKLIKDQTVPKVFTEMIDNLKNDMPKSYQIIMDLKSQVQIIHYCIDEIKVFFDGDKLLLDLENYSKIYDNLLRMFAEFENKQTNNSSYISEQVNKLSEIFEKFIEQKYDQLQDPQTVKIIRQLTDLEKSVYSYFEIIKSNNIVIECSKNKYYEIIKTIHICESLTPNIEMTSPKTSNMDFSLVSNDDNEIKDNIVLRTLMEKSLEEIQQIWSKMNLS